MERKTASIIRRELLTCLRIPAGDINRRAFLDGAAGFTIGGLTVWRNFSSLTPNYAWAQQVPRTTNASRSVTSRASPDGNLARSRLPGAPGWNGKLPVVLVIRETAG